MNKFIQIPFYFVIVLGILAIMQQPLIQAAPTQLLTYTNDCLSCMISNFKNYYCFNTHACWTAYQTGCALNYNDFVS